MYYGGKAIESGGMGCIFKPALKCIDDKSRPNNSISKLMHKHFANIEIYSLLNAMPIIKSIPNYNKYFIIDDIKICQPSVLSFFDRLSIKNKCEQFNNINENIDDYTIITMPYGGEDMYNVYNNKKLPNKLFNKINNKLIKLLLNAIIPINNKKLYHFDIKPENILIKDNNLRIIDWGVSYIDYGVQVPENIFLRPFQKNCMITNLLFDKIFIENYTIFLRNNPYNKNINNVKLFITKHYIKDKLNNDEINILTSVIIAFTDYTNLSFDYIKYYNDVYKHNIDIYGLVMCYKLFLNNVSKSIKKNLNNLFNNYKPIFNLEKIDLNAILYDLEKLNYINETKKVNFTVNNKTRKNKNLKILNRKPTPYYI